MDKKDNIRYVSLLFTAFRGTAVALSAPPVSAPSELRLLGHRQAPRLTATVASTSQEHVRHCAR